MSKAIKMTPQIEEDVRRSFEAALKGVKFADGKISFTKSFAQTNQKATVYFTEIAWRKMEALIKEFDKEVAWHGVATRIDSEDKNEYLISDIIVYPQEVTGATVDTDQEKYQTWLFDLDEDVFNNLRAQGHSHVNMATSPSSTDLTHQEAILSRIEDDMFYIFMIWNKRGERTIKIYDLAKNTLFEPADVSVSVFSDINMSEFIKDAKEMVKSKACTPSYSGYKGGYYSGYDYDDDYYYGRGYHYTHSEKKADDKKEDSVKTSATQTKPVTTVLPVADSSKKNDKKRKGKRKRW